MTGRQVRQVRKNGISMTYHYGIRHVISIGPFNKSDKYEK